MKLIGRIEDDCLVVDGYLTVDRAAFFSGGDRAEIFGGCKRNMTITFPFCSKIGTSGMMDFVEKKYVINRIDSNDTDILWIKYGEFEIPVDMYNFFRPFEGRKIIIEWDE